MKELTYAVKKEWYNLILLLLPLLAAPFLWDLLPDRVPIHWSFAGEVDQYGSKEFGLFFNPALALTIYLVLLFLPKIDPKKRIKVDQKPIPALRTLVVLLILGMHSWFIATALGITGNSQSWIFLGLSLFFVVIGNYLRTVPPNYFIGIRVPWALEHPENWRKTHRLGSYVWVAGGVLLMLLFPLFSTQIYIYLFGGIAILLAVIPTLYSFYLYKQTEYNPNHE